MSTTDGRHTCFKCETIPAPPITDVKERILGVAVLLPGFLFQASAPRRHGDLLSAARVVSGVHPECGFYSNHRVWLNRREAYLVAKASGQYIEHRPFARTDGVLMSEDVW